MENPDCVTNDNIISFKSYNEFEDGIFINQINTIKRECLSLSDLFKGFDTLKVITFSYSLGFIEHIIKYFKYVEIIIGADFIHENDEDLKQLEAYVFSNGVYYNKEVNKLINKYPVILDMLKSGDLVIRISRMIIDHRKLYILRDSSSEKTRVITGSANMSNSAWCGNQMETIEYDDGKLRYDIELNNFEVAIENSSEILHDVLAFDLDDYVKSNPILQDESIKKKSCGLLFANIQSENNYKTAVKYLIDFSKDKKIYDKLLKSCKVKRKDSKGLSVVEPKLITSFERQQTKFKQILSMKPEIKSIEYPTFNIDFENDVILYNDRPLDLTPNDDSVKSDINELLGIFNNFNKFVGDTDELKETHFQLLNALFSSPFHAPVRCIAYTYNRVPDAMPLFLAISSPTASCGKTFMIKAIMRMMSGYSVEPYNSVHAPNADFMRVYHRYLLGFPVFFDEFSGFHNIKDFIKMPDDCEQNNRSSQPMLIFASNTMNDLDDTYRKRVIYLKLTARFSSDYDIAKAKSIGDAILSRLSSSFYHKYLSYMFELTKAEIEYMVSDVPDGYYPDLLKLSSRAIISVLQDYGYSVPEYMRELTYKEDYSVNASATYKRTLKDVDNYYNSNPLAFEFKTDSVIIHMGNEDKKATSWVNTLPAELRAQKLPTRGDVLIVIDKKEYFKRSRFKHGFLDRFMRKVSYR